MSTQKFLFLNGPKHGQVLDIAVSAHDGIKNIPPNSIMVAEMPDIGLTPVAGWMDCSLYNCNQVEYELTTLRDPDGTRYVYLYANGPRNPCAALIELASRSGLRERIKREMDMAMRCVNDYADAAAKAYANVLEWMGEQP